MTSRTRRKSPSCFFETGSKYNRGRYVLGGCDAPIGPEGADVHVGCAGFSENPTHNTRHVWGRMMHEIGHAFQQPDWAVHPSAYNSDFELMDAALPGHVSAWSLQPDRSWPGWLPGDKTESIGLADGGGYTCLWALEYNAYDKPTPQVLRIDISAQVYYLASVRRAVNGDELNGFLQDSGFTNPGIPDEGVIIEFVDESAAQTVTLQAPPGKDRRALWQKGDRFDATADDLHIEIENNFDDDFYCFTYWFGSNAGKPDLMMHPWTSPPGNTWETTDIWIDSPLNGYGTPSETGWLDDGTLRYGVWDDGDGYDVPRGNGDNPAIAQANRLYARVHNTGTAPATDVEVTFQNSDPPGVGIREDTAWATIGTVDQTDFPALASIAAGDAVEVWIEWAPSYALPDAEEVDDGSFNFHTCVRVLLASSSADLTLTNQDGVREQENIAYFDVAAHGSSGALLSQTLRLHNPDENGERDFTFVVDTDAPGDWDISVNGDVNSVTVPAGGMKVVDVEIVPGQGAQPGERYGFDVSVVYDRYLVSDLDVLDRHLEVANMGGVRFEAGVGWPAAVHCAAELVADGRVRVAGTLWTDPLQQGGSRPLPVFLQGVTAESAWLSDVTALVYAESRTGNFVGYLQQARIGDVARVACLFGGTEDIVADGFVASQIRVFGPVFFPSVPTLPTVAPCALLDCGSIGRVCLDATGCFSAADPESWGPAVNRVVRDVVPPSECSVSCATEVVEDNVPCTDGGCDSIGDLDDPAGAVEAATRVADETVRDGTCSETVCVTSPTILEAYRNFIEQAVCRRVEIRC